MLVLDVTSGTSVVTEWPRLLLAALSGCRTHAVKPQRTLGAAAELRHRA